MGEQETGRGKIKIVVGGAVSGIVAAGDHNIMTQTNLTTEPVSAEELAQLREAIAALREQIAQQAPADQKAPALQRVNDLEEAVLAKKPDQSTIASVKNWFVAHVPALAGAVTSIVVDPIVGRLVRAAGDTLAADLQSNLGPQ
jgi:hypothetical protein